MEIMERPEAHIEPTFRLQPPEDQKFVPATPTCAVPSPAERPRSGATTADVCGAPSLAHSAVPPRRFSVAAARRVLEDVVTSQLQGKAWQGEEEAVWTISLTEAIKARIKG